MPEPSSGPDLASFGGSGAAGGIVGTNHLQGAVDKLVRTVDNFDSAVQKISQFAGKLPGASLLSGQQGQQNFGGFGGLVNKPATVNGGSQGGTSTLTQNQMSAQATNGGFPLITNPFASQQGQPTGGTPQTIGSTANISQPMQGSGQQYPQVVNPFNTQQQPQFFGQQIQVQQAPQPQASSGGTGEFPSAAGTGAINPTTIFPPQQTPPGGAGGGAGGPGGGGTGSFPPMGGGSPGGNGGMLPTLTGAATAGASMMAQAGASNMNGQLALNTYQYMGQLAMNGGSYTGNQQALAQQAYGTAGNYTGAAQKQNIFGQNPTDLAQAYGIMGSVAGNPMLNQTQLGSRMLQGTAQTSYLNPAMSATQSAQAMQQLYSPQESMRMQMMGYTGTPLTMGKPGARGMGTVMASLFQGWGLSASNKLNPSQMAAQLGPNGVIYQNLKALGMNPSQYAPTVEAYNRLFQGWGKKGAGSNPELGATQAQSLLGKLSSQNPNTQKQAEATLQKYGINQNDLDRLKGEAGTKAAKEGDTSRGFTAGLQAATRSLSDFNTALQKSINTMGGQSAEGFGQGFGGTMGMLGHGAITGGGMALGGLLLKGLLGGALGKGAGSVLGKGGTSILSKLLGKIGGMGGGAGADAAATAGEAGAGATAAAGAGEAGGIGLGTLGGLAAGVALPAAAAAGWGLFTANHPETAAQRKKQLHWRKWNKKHPGQANPDLGGGTGLHFAFGGEVPGKGNADDKHISATAGEWVLNKTATQTIKKIFGKEFLKILNQAGGPGGTGGEDTLGHGSMMSGSEATFSSGHSNSLSGLFGGGSAGVATSPIISASSQPGGKGKQTNKNSSGVSKTAEMAVKAAESQEGVPYVWGKEEAGKGFDCAGLTQWAYEKAGIKLPRTAKEQWMYLQQREVKLNQVQEGDLVFGEGSDGELGHVGIMVNGKKVLQAPQAGQKVGIYPFEVAQWLHAARPSGGKLQKNQSTHAGKAGTSSNPIIKAGAGGSNPAGSPTGGKQGSGKKNGGGVSGQQIADYAKKFVGHRYVLGGPGDYQSSHNPPFGPWDCAGFVTQMYDHFGIHPSGTVNVSGLIGWSKHSKSPTVGGMAFFAGADGTSSHPGHVGLVTGSNQMVNAEDEAAGTRMASLAGAVLFGVPPNGFSGSGTGGSGGGGGGGGGATVQTGLSPQGGSGGMGGGGADLGTGDTENEGSTSETASFAGAISGGVTAGSGYYGNSTQVEEVVPGSGSGGSSGSTGNGGFSGTGGKAVYTYLLNNVFGGNKVAAAGATGSIWGESKWNPESQGTGGRGLIGWTPPGTLPNSAFTGNASKDMAAQLKQISVFIQKNGDQGTIDQMKKASTVEQAAQLWDHGVERAGVNDVHSEGITLAKQIAGLATGGVADAGDTFMAGERGPELIQVSGKKPANVYSSDQTQKLLKSAVGSPEGPWSSGQTNGYGYSSANPIFQGSIGGRATSGSGNTVNLNFTSGSVVVNMSSSSGSLPTGASARSAAKQIVQEIAKIDVYNAIKSGANS